MCYVTLCCVVLCYVVLCSIVICCAVLLCAVLCCVMLYCVILLCVAVYLETCMPARAMIMPEDQDRVPKDAGKTHQPSPTLGPVVSTSHTAPQQPNYPGFTAFL